MKWLFPSSIHTASTFLLAIRNHSVPCSCGVHPVGHLSLCLLEPVNTDEQGWIRWGECWTPETPLLTNTSEPGVSLFLLSSAQERGRGGGVSQESDYISHVLDLTV